MFARTGITISYAKASLAVALVAVGTLAAPTSPAVAQGGLFGSIFGGMGVQQRPSRTYTPAYAAQPDDGQDYGERPARRAERPAHAAGPASSYCVRLCDGKYFPIPRSSSGVQLSSVKVCSALCPRAPTKVFNGSDPGRSVATDGTKYDDLENAFAYREKVVPDCSCTGNGPGGLAQIDVETDPTLRAGDVVAREGGLQVFNGAGKAPYKSADFTPVGNYARVSADLRSRLVALRVDETAVPATPVQSLAVSANDGQVVAESKPKPQRPRRARVQRADSDSGDWGWGGRSNGGWDSFWR